MNLTGVRAHGLKSDQALENELENIKKRRYF